MSWHVLFLFSYRGKKKDVIFLYKQNGKQWASLCILTHDFLICLCVNLLSSNSFFWQILWRARLQWLLNACFWCVIRRAEAVITLSRLLLLWSLKSYTPSIYTLNMSYALLMVHFFLLGSNAYSYWVPFVAVPRLVAYTSLVPVFSKQGIWKLFFFINHWVVFNIQAYISCREGILLFNLVSRTWNLSLAFFVTTDKMFLRF